MRLSLYNPVRYENKQYPVSFGFSIGDILLSKKIEIGDRVELSNKSKLELFPEGLKNIFTPEQEEVIVKLYSSFKNPVNLNLNKVSEILADSGINYNQFVSSKQFFEEAEAAINGNTPRDSYVGFLSKYAKAKRSRINELKLIARELHELQEKLDLYNTILQSKDDYQNIERKIKENSIEQLKEQERLSYLHQLLKKKRELLTNLQDKRSYAFNLKLNKQKLNRKITSVNYEINNIKNEIQKSNKRLNRCNSVLKDTNRSMEVYNNSLKSLSPEEDELLQTGKLNILAKEIEAKIKNKKRDIDRLNYQLNSIESILVKDYVLTTSVIGRDFESIAAYEVDNKLVPRLAEKIAEKESSLFYKVNPKDIESKLIHVRNLELGPNIELDHVILRVNGVQNNGNNYPSEIVAIAETKYNLESIPSGYIKRMQNLSHLCGKSNIVVNQIMNNPDFKVHTIEDINGKKYSITKDSFKSLDPSRNPDWRENLYFISSYRNPNGLSNRFFSNSDFYENYSKPELQDNLILINNSIIPGIELADVFISGYVSQKS